MTPEQWKIAFKVFRYDFSDYTDIFQSPWKGFCPRLIATKFSPVIDYGLKFVET